MSTGLMAEPKKKGKPGPKPDPSRNRTAVIMVRGMPDWKAWIEELAEHMRSPSVGDLIDKALVAYARDNKFPKSAPPR